MSLLPAWLGLVWATWQISRRELSKHDKSKKHEGLTTFINYVVGWAVLVGLVLSVSQVPAPINEYLAVAISVIYAIVMVWAYLGDRISKTAIVPRQLQGTKVLFIIIFVTACIDELPSLYMLYESSYLWGSYDVLSSMAKILGLPVHEALPTIYRGIVSSPAGVALSTISIAFVMYRRGLLRGREGNRTHARLSEVRS